MYLVGDVDNGEGCASVEAGALWKSLYLPFNFSVNLKLKSVFFNMRCQISEPSYSAALCV